MRDAPYPDVPPDFGHWLAGFIDGEGCFDINHNRRQGNLHCRITVRLRDDDLSIIEEIAKVTGCGRVVRYRRPPQVPWKTKPYALWHVLSRADCLRMVHLLDRYPLRAKKRRDYAIWREAVITWQGISLTGRGKPENRAIWDRMAQLAAAVVEVRAYHGSVVPSEVADLDAVPGLHQLALGEGIAAGEVVQVEVREG